MKTHRVLALRALLLAAACLWVAAAPARAEEAQPQSAVPTDVTFRLRQAAEVLEASDDPEDREIAEWLREKEGLAADRPIVRSIKGAAT